MTPKLCTVLVLKFQYLFYCLSKTARRVVNSVDPDQMLQNVQLLIWVYIIYSGLSLFIQDFHCLSRTSTVHFIQKFYCLFRTSTVYSGLSLFIKDLKCLLRTSTVYSGLSLFIQDFSLFNFTFSPNQRQFWRGFRGISWTPFDSKISFSWMGQFGLIRDTVFTLNIHTRFYSTRLFNKSILLPLNMCKIRRMSGK